MENNSKHQEGVGSYSVMEDLEVVHDTNRGVGQQYEEDTVTVTDINVMWPRWGDSTRLYDNHPARMGSSIKLYNTTQEYSQEYSIMLYRRDIDRSMSAVYRVMCRLLQLHINPFISGYDIITWINTYG